MNNWLLKITQIKTNSLILALFMVPPFSFIYFYVLIVFLSQRINRNTAWLSVWFTILFIGTNLLLVYYFLEPGSAENFFNNSILNCILVFLASLMIILVIYATVLSVKFERQKNEEHFHMNTDMDYLSRFFTLLFLPFTIWVYHPVFLSYLSIEDPELN